MTDVTIPDLPAGTTLDGSEPVETVQGGVSVKTTTAAIAALGGGGGAIVNVTTNPTTPTDVNFVPGTVYSVTTSGSAGSEVLNLISPSATVGGFANPTIMGARVNVGLFTQGDPSDILQITLDGNASISSYTKNLNEGSYTQTSECLLEYEGGAMSFLWCNDVVCIDPYINDQSDSAVWISEPVGIASQSTSTGASGSINMLTGSSGDSNTGNITINSGSGPGGSGQVILQTGSSNGGGSGNVGLITGSVFTGTGAGNISLLPGIGGSADGGSIYLTPGGSVSAKTGKVYIELDAPTEGYLIIDGLPTSDPHVVHVIWNNGGVLTVSAG